MAALRVSDLDMLRRRVDVLRSVADVKGALVWGTPKTHERRSVPFPAALAEVIAPLMVGRGRDDLVFTAKGGGVLRNSTWRPRVFDKAVTVCQAQAATARHFEETSDATRLDFPSLSRQDLRHIAASLASSAAANVKAVQWMLSHAKASVTLATYADLFDDDLDLVAGALDRKIHASRLATTS